jgi:hypothetical protein
VLKDRGCDLLFGRCALPKCSLYDSGEAVEIVYTHLFGHVCTSFLFQCTSQPVQLHSFYGASLVYSYNNSIPTASINPSLLSPSSYSGNLTHPVRPTRRKAGTVYQPNRLPPPPPFLPPRRASFSSHWRRISLFCISCGRNSLVSNWASCLLNARSVGRLVICARVSFGSFPFPSPSLRLQPNPIRTGQSILPGT